MRDFISNIYTFRTAQFLLTVDAFVDPDLDTSWDETGDVIEGLDSGRYVSFMVRTRLVHGDSGLEAEDWLGNCIYESPAAFMDHRGIKKHPGCGSYFSDMVRTVCDEMRATLARTQTIKVRRHVS
jgi:hypothetical protein